MASVSVARRVSSQKTGGIGNQNTGPGRKTAKQSGKR